MKSGMVGRRCHTGSGDRRYPLEPFILELSAMSRTFVAVLLLTLVAPALMFIAAASAAGTNPDLIRMV